MTNRPDSARRALRIGVVGTGIGVAHIKALGQVPSVVVAAVCSARRARAEAVAARFEVSLATDDFRDLLRADLDAVVIATPPPFHAAMVMDAIAAGLHVFCEKPLAATPSEARRMRDAAHEAGIVHAVGYQLRYQAPFALARQRIDEGYLGQLAVGDCQFFLNPVDYLRSAAGSASKAAWYTDARQSGGMLGSASGPHQIDLLQWYGGPIVAVATEVAVSHPEVELADGTRLGGITAEDAFLILARFAGGGMATIRGVPVAYHGFGMTLDLHGTAGSLHVGFNELRGATSANRSLVDLALPVDPVSERVAILEHFVTAVRSGDPALASTLPTFDDGVANQAVLNACLAAASAGAWVTVERS